MAARTRLVLITAPPALSPGGYVGRAYADRVTPRTLEADLEASFDAGTWTIALSWRADHPSRALEGDPARFVDSAALLVPTTETAQPTTMGAPTDPVEGVRWHADAERPLRIEARGLGTVERRAAPPDWTTDAHWNDGFWHLSFRLRGWAALDRFQRLAVAFWQGAESERAGLKSVTPQWIPLT